jgi:hypothetical protein
MHANLEEDFKVDVHRKNSAITPRLIQFFRRRHHPFLIRVYSRPFAVWYFICVHPRSAAGQDVPCALIGQDASADFSGEKEHYDSPLFVADEH